MADVRNILKNPPIPNAKPSSSSSTNSPSVNVAPYTVTVVSQLNEKAIVVNAPLPEDFSFSINSNYSAPFEDSGLVSGSKLQGAASFAGFTGLIQAMSAQLWTSSTGVEITLPFNFVSRNNPLTEVRTPILNLLKLCSPRAETSFSLLTPPGPTLDKTKILDVAQAFLGLTLTEAGSVIGLVSDSERESKLAGIQATFESAIKNPISLAIGRFIYFSNVVITGVDIQFTSVLSENQFLNFPWKVSANVSFRTFVTPTYRDLERIFRVGT